MPKPKPQVFESIPSADLQAYRRTQWFETAKTYIQIFLMWVFALFVFAFVLLTVLAGVTSFILPDTEGVRALSLLFTEIAGNAKAVGLFAIGFYFREYLNAKSQK